MVPLAVTSAPQKELEQRAKLEVLLLDPLEVVSRVQWPQQAAVQA